MKHLRTYPSHVQGAEILRVFGHGARTILFRIGGRAKRIAVPSHPQRPDAVVLKRCAKADALCAKHARAVAC